MHKTTRRILRAMRSAWIALLLLGVVFPSHALGSDIKVFCTQALKGVVAKVGPQYERESGNKLVMTYGATGQLVDQVDKGETFDVIIVIKPALEKLAKQGKVLDASRIDVAKAGVGVAIRKGAARPDISTVEAFKKTLLNAKSISYTNPADGGASGVYIAGVIKKLGLAEQLAPKTKLAPGGTSSGSLVASGDSELAMQMISELVPIPGIEILGPLPPAIQSYSVLSAGVSSGAADKKAAEGVIAFLTSPAVAPVLREKGLEPAK